jgi:hypothetical protein
MMEDKELPSEYVSIRAIWLKGIEECRKAISHRVINDSSEMRFDMDAGDRTLINSVLALYLSLVDYGEATIKSDVKHWYETVYKVKNREIWSKADGSFSTVGDRESCIHDCWKRNALLSERFYDFIIQILNKYGMLFQEQPQGYSNVVIEEIK